MIVFSRRPVCQGSDDPADGLIRRLKGFQPATSTRDDLVVLVGGQRWESRRYEGLSETSASLNAGESRSGRGEHPGVPRGGLRLRWGAKGRSTGTAALDGRRVHEVDRIVGEDIRGIVLRADAVVGLRGDAHRGRPGRSSGRSRSTRRS